MHEDHWHALPVEEVFKRLETGPHGLSPEEARRRLEKYGLNEIEAEEKVSKLEMVVRQVKSPIIVILVAAAAIAYVVGKVIDTLVIAIVIALNTIIGFVQEYKAEEALQALKALAAPEAKVLRQCPGRTACIEMKIKARELVPGDVILLEVGDRVPADARIFEAVNLEIDESMLTGESIPVRKIIEPLDPNTPVSDRRNMAFAGTIVTQGRGKAIVVATGMRTEIGKIASLIRIKEERAIPLKKRITDLGKKITIFAIVACSIVLVVTQVKGFALFDSFMMVLAMTVSAVPEGLPVVITIALAIGVHRMAKRNAIIRNLQAIETLGSATVICTDKTGTLTTNQMTVRKIFVSGRLVNITGVGYNPEGDFHLDGRKIDPKEDHALTLILQVGALCNNAKLIQHKLNGESRWEVYGDPTEGALIVAAAKAGFQKEDLDEKYPRIDEIPFNPEKKYMVTFHKTAEGSVLVCMKGAPETVLEHCSHIQLDNRVAKLTKDQREAILKVATEMAGEALRVLGAAYRIIEEDNLRAFKEAIEQGHAKLTFLGIFGMIDPPRPEAKLAIEVCKKAGIRVIMITGDHRLTAEAIGKELGILEPGLMVLTGTELDQMSDEELDSVIDKVAVFARATPLHKYRIVESLRRKGHIVAMTGDGVNDAPALKKAEIGIAMGITGTDVAKEASDMILTDDNFASIVNAVEEGRVIFDNIRKVVKYLLSTNTGEIVAISGALLFLPKAPLIFTPVQILWVNLVTDGLHDKFLAMEPKERDVMNRPPRDPRESIVDKDTLLGIMFVSAFMAAGAIFMFNLAWSAGDLEKARTLGFTTMAMFQVFHAWNCRSPRESVFRLGLRRNKYLLIGSLVSVCLQVLATTLPPLQIALGTTPLTPWEWGLIFLITSSVLFAEELRKLMHRKFLKK